MDDPASLPSSSFNLALPPSSGINEFWPESQHFVALPQDLQRPITSHHGAIHVGFCLLLAVVNTVQPKDKASATPTALAHYVPWIVDSVRALWRHFTRWTISPTKRPIYDEVTLAYIQLLESSFIPSAISGDRSPISLKTAQALTSSLAELIDNLAVSPAAEVIQIRIASIFARLRSILSSQHADTSIPQRRQDLSKFVVQAGLEDSVNKCCQDVEQFIKLDKDLQVSERRHYMLPH